MEAWGREEELWDHTGLGRMDSNHRSRDLEDGQVPGISGSWGQRCLPTFVWYESATTWLLEEAQDGLHPRRLERVTWGMEGGHISPPWLGEGAAHPRKHGEDVPTGEEAVPHSWPCWGSKQLQGAPRRTERCPSPPIFSSSPVLFWEGGDVRTRIGRAEFALFFHPAAL